MPAVRCSVVDPARAAALVDVEISAPAGTPWRLIAPLVAARLELAVGAQFDAGSHQVADEAPLGYPPLVHGVLLVVRRTSAAPTRARGLLELHVVGGPDSGRIHTLAPGEHSIGRSPSAQVRLDDADASRWHASLAVGADGLSVRDLGSVNGTSVGALAVGTAPQPVQPGQRIQVGRTTLSVRSPAVRLASTRARGEGTLDVNRAPRPCPPRAPVHLQRPAPVPAPDPQRWPWAAMLLPLAVAAPLSLFMRQPMFLLFALMGPVMVVANTVTDRSRGRRTQREAAHRWATQNDELSQRLQAALAAELAARRAANPDAAELLRTVTRPSARLWERPPDGGDVLSVLLGTGRIAADVSLTAADGSSEPQHLQQAPVTVALRGVGHLGLAGPREEVLALARHLVCQVAAWHGPQVARIVVLAGDADSAAQWQWTRWLPHQRGGPVGRPEQAQSLVAAMHERVLAERAHPPHGPPTGPVTVLVVDQASRQRALPRLAALLRDGPSAGVHAICLDDDLSGLAGECRATFEIGPDGARLVSDEAALAQVCWDGVSHGWAETVARALAGLRDATPQTGGAALPSGVRLLDLLGLDPTDPEAVARAWRIAPATTSVLVGVDSDGPASIDLCRDGPHALVAGTTGAGKSELLRTLVTALAIANRPDGLSFVLVDYKGGAAFGDCADLPHTAGLVTDLDEHLAARALTSLGAELSRRERALKALGCNDMGAYQRARDADPLLAPIPRLVVVIDEFRLLAEELPEFVNGLVRIAAVGRSLGVHLVLATQRPAGIVSADIKANVNLRIALRVRDRADSDDVIDAPDAAGLDAATPGRALCRSGSEPLRAIQVALVSGSGRPPDPDTVTVRRATAGVVSGVDTGVDAGSAERPDEDLKRVVRCLRAAATSAGIEPAAPAWLAPLPRSLALESLPSGGLGDGIAIGLVDLPEQQRQPTLLWHPVEDGHLGLCGGPRSGRTSALATVAIALSRAWSPDTLHLHVIDAASGQLRDLAALPHTGTVLGRDQPRLVARLVDRLAAEVRRRLVNDCPAAPPMVLLVDGWDALVGSLDQLDHGRTSEALIALLRDGPAAGLRAVVAGDRALVTSRLTAVLPERLLLRVTDPTDLLLSGLPAAALAANPPPGRAVRTRDGASVQLATTLGCTGTAGQTSTARCTGTPGQPSTAGRVGVAATLARAAEQARAAWPRSRPEGRVRVIELPASVGIERVDHPNPGGRRALLGVGGDEGHPMVLDLDVHRSVLVAGPPGSGRSTTLHTIAHSLHRAGAAVLAVCPRSSLLDAGPWPVVGPLEDRPLIEQVAAHPRACVLVDDVELLTDSPLDAVLDSLIRQRGPTAVVLAGTTSALLGQFRGASVSARSARTGVLLQPVAASDGELFGVRAELPDHARPGRGLLIIAGKQRALQVGTHAPISAFGTPRRADVSTHTPSW